MLYQQLPPANFSHPVQLRAKPITATAVENTAVLSVSAVFKHIVVHLDLQKD